MKAEGVKDMPLQAVCLRAHAHLERPTKGFEEICAAIILE
jgi:hypothetical protein